MGICEDRSESTTGPRPRRGPRAGSPSGLHRRHRLLSEPGAPGAARDILNELRRELEPEQLDTLRLLVTELVTNAVRHADSGPITLEIALLPDVIQISVADAGRGFSASARKDDLLAVGGWGLFLVNELADRWGISESARSEVWFELDRGPGARPAGPEATTGIEPV